MGTSIDAITSACASLSVASAGFGLSANDDASEIVLTIQKHFDAKWRNLFIRHSGAHYETIALRRSSKNAIPMTTLLAAQTVVVDLNDDDDPPAARSPVVLPEWKLPTPQEFRDRMRTWDDVQILRHGLKVLYVATLRRLVAEGKTERARSLTAPLVLDSVMHPDVVPSASQPCLASKYWANNYVYGLVSELLGASILVTSTSAGGWLRGSADGKVRLHPQYEASRAASPAVALRLQDFKPDAFEMDVLRTPDDGRCFYHAVVQALRQPRHIQLPLALEGGRAVQAVRPGPPLAWRPPRS